MKKKIFLTIILFILSFLSAVAAEEKLIILDASLSMNQPLNGVPKYVVAINAAKSQLQKLNQEELVGLRTIGLTIDASLLTFLTDPSALCRATQLVAPIRSYNIANIESALDSIVPLGTTPLTYSIDTAIKYDFISSSNTKHIILITDGGESCEENPCSYIRNLMQRRKDLIIDVIAIGVTGDELSQLKCLTEATSGTIITANTSNQIEDAFYRVLQPTADIQPQNQYNTQIQPQNQLFKSNDITYKNYIIETYD